MYQQAWNRIPESRKETLLQKSHMPLTPSFKVWKLPWRTCLCTTFVSSSPLGLVWCQPFFWACLRMSARAARIQQFLEVAVFDWEWGNHKQCSDKWQNHTKPLLGWNWTFVCDHRSYISINNLHVIDLYYIKIYYNIIFFYIKLYYIIQLHLCCISIRWKQYSRVIEAKIFWKTAILSILKVDSYLICFLFSTHSSLCHVPKFQI